MRAIGDLDLKAVSFASGFPSDQGGNKTNSENTQRTCKNHKVHFTPFDDETMNGTNRLVVRSGFGPSWKTPKLGLVIQSPSDIASKSGDLQKDGFSTVGFQVNPPHWGSLRKPNGAGRRRRRCRRWSPGPRREWTKPSAPTSYACAFFVWSFSRRVLGLELL